jgi:type I pantothenate kinase
MDSPYLDFDRAAWAALREATPLTLTETDLSELQGLNERVSLVDVEEIYLPVSRLLNLHVAATQTLHKATETFLNSPPAPTPYVIGVGGSVAVGKSTFARILRALLARWPDHPRVDLVTTDGFLLPNRDLEERGQLARKGFPGELRRAVARPVHGRRQGGQGRRARPRVLPSVV